MPTLPAWIDADRLDSTSFCGLLAPLGVVGEAKALLEAYSAPLPPPDARFTHYALARLRLRTIIREEDRETSRARFRELRADLADVAPNVLAAAIDKFVNSAGARFYPTAGELRVHINELLGKRAVRAWRLRQVVADCVKAERDEALRLERERMAQSGEPLGFAGLKADDIRPKVKRIDWDAEARAAREAERRGPLTSRIPTVEELVERGASRAEAMQLVEIMQRPLKRQWGGVKFGPPAPPRGWKWHGVEHGWEYLGWAPTPPPLPYLTDLADINDLWLSCGLGPANYAELIERTRRSRQ